MKLLITGGRDYNNYSQVASSIKGLNPSLIIQGGAKGADLMARTYAKTHGVPCITFEADWKKHGKSAGPIRNSLMLRAHLDAVVLAFPGGRGTADCVQQAQGLGLTVIRVV